MPNAPDNLTQQELLVLLAVIRLEQNRVPACLSEVVTVLDERLLTRSVVDASVFTTLEKLWDKGRLKKGTMTSLKDGPGRKTKWVYTLTKTGEQDVNLALRDLYSVSAGIRLWDEVDQDVTDSSPATATQTGLIGVKTVVDEK